MGQQLGDFVDQIVEIHRSGLELALAGEGEQLGSQVRSALGRGEDVGRGLVQVGFAADPVLDQFGPTDDAGQLVVEIVGHAAGQLSDGLELLGLAELLFHDFAVVDVADHRQDPVLAADFRQSQGYLDPEVHSVFTPGHPLEHLRPFLDRPLHVCLGVFGRVGRGPDQGALIGSCLQFLAVEPENFEHPVVHIQDGSGGRVVDKNGVTGSIEDLAVIAFADVGADQGFLHPHRQQAHADRGPQGDNEQDGDVRGFPETVVFVGDDPLIVEDADGHDCGKHQAGNSVEEHPAQDKAAQGDGHRQDDDGGVMDAVPGDHSTQGKKDDGDQGQQAGRPGMSASLNEDDGCKGDRRSQGQLP